MQKKLFFQHLEGKKELRIPKTTSVYSQT
jgi:hypothetical protein